MAISGLAGLRRLSRSLARGAGLATARFPVAALLTVVIAALANGEIEGLHVLPEDEIAWFLASLTAALSFSIAVRLVAESHGWGSVPRRLAPPIGALAAGLLIWNAEGLGVLAPPLLAALCLSIPLAPYVGRNDDRKFWTFTLWTAVGITLAFVSVLIFVLGVSAILEMIRYLFGIGLSSLAYEHIYATALLLVGPLFALGRIPTEFDEAVASGAGDRLTNGVRPLLGWVASPLTLATAVVIHLYAAKILVTQDVPKGEIGWIVSVYSVLVLSLRVAAEPFLVDGAASTRLFGRLWAPLLVVPTALLVYAVGIRIEAEGVTLERYCLALAAIATVLAVALQVTRWRGDIRLIVAVPLALLALSSFGPWGAAATVGRSQTAMLVRGLAEGADIDAAGLDETGRSSMRSRLQALQEVGELDRVLPYLSESQRADVAARTAGRPDQLSASLLSVLGLDYGRATPAATEWQTYAAGQATVLDLGGFDRALIDRTVQAPSAGGGEAAVDEVSLRLDGEDLVVSVGGTTDRFPLTATIAAMTAAGPDASGVPIDAGAARPLVADLVSAKGRKVRARITVATWEKASHAPISLSATFLLRRADWPASLGGGTPLR